MQQNWDLWGKMSLGASDLFGRRLGQRKGLREMERNKQGKNREKGRKNDADQG